MAKTIGKRTFDARPDRVDIRDREYRPPLRNLPESFPSQKLITQYLPLYTKHLILDQGNEGACTGFGLAAVINYLLWKVEIDKLGPDDKAAKTHLPTVKSVSPSMLYRMARVYDEWPGEDYEGSSCRGAMKGWHRHGVCADENWPYRTKSGQVRYIKPKDGWQDDAGRRPLGAYYRINKNAIVDMQAAICEVGAIYVSSDVHEGWDEVTQSNTNAPVIREPKKPEDVGGHAFAIVGYSEDGFIIQNSWGPNWGFHGFAVLTYSDWVRHGTDAWVAVMGAPVRVQASRTHPSVSLEQQASGRASWLWSGNRAGRSVPSEAKAQPWEESAAYEHALVLENDGRPVNRYLDVRSGEEAVQEAAETRPLRWLKGKKSPKLAIYAHGGLNNEEASVNRIRVMAPYFAENDIYPLFLTWRTWFLESIQGILTDAVTRFFAPSPEDVARGRLIQGLVNQIQEARDRSIEVASEQLLVKAVWTQMKQNAAAAARPPALDPGEVGTTISPAYRAACPGLVLLADHLRTLKKSIPKLEIHLMGHSAGSILLGHLLDRLVKPKVEVASLSLYAPACTVDFAVQKFVAAVEDSKILKGETIYVDILNEEREQADSVGPYGKSLLYLVSRALEDRHKTPLLGMEQAWKGAGIDNKTWPQDFHPTLARWQTFAKKGVKLIAHGQEKVNVAPNQTIGLAHGSFDNDIDVISRTLQTIRADGKPLPVPVTGLVGF